MDTSELWAKRRILNADLWAPRSQPEVPTPTRNPSTVLTRLPSQRSWTPSTSYLFLIHALHCSTYLVVRDYNGKRC